MIERMKQVEKHIIKPTHPAWRELDELAFKSKNLDNKANYLIRLPLYQRK
jgi:putative transposase